MEKAVVQLIFKSTRSPTVNVRKCDSIFCFGPQTHCIYSRRQYTVAAKKKFPYRY